MICSYCFDKWTIIIFYYYKQVHQLIHTNTICKKSPFRISAKCTRLDQIYKQPIIIMHRFNKSENRSCHWFKKAKNRSHNRYSADKSTASQLISRDSNETPCRAQHDERCVKDYTVYTLQYKYKEHNATISTIWHTTTAFWIAYMIHHQQRNNLDPFYTQSCVI